MRLLLALSLFAAPARAAVSGLSDKLAHIDAPDGWTPEKPLPEDDAGVPVLALHYEDRMPMPTFRAYPLGKPLEGEALRELAKARAQTRSAWGGAGGGELADWTSTSGLRLVYYEALENGGAVFEGACDLGTASYWLSSRNVDRKTFIQLVGGLKLGPAPAAAPAAKQAKRAPTAAQPAGRQVPAPQPIRIAAPPPRPVSDMPGSRLAAHGRWFSAVVPPGYIPIEGGLPDAVLALSSGDSLIEVYRLPPGGPTLHLRYYLFEKLRAYVAWPELLGRFLARTSGSGAAIHLAGSSAAGGWIVAEFSWNGDGYWYLATGPSTEQSVEALVGSFAPGHAPIGGKDFPEAPEGSPLPSAPSGAVVPAALLLFVLLYKFAFSRGRFEHVWSQEFKTPELLGVTSPWKHHVLAGARCYARRGFSREVALIEGAHNRRFRAEWPRPERPAALAAAAMGFFGSLALVSPLGADAFGTFGPAAIYGLGAGILVRILMPRPPCILLDGRGHRVGSIEHAPIGGMAEQRFKVMGLEQEFLGYLARERSSRLWRKSWEVLDSGSDLICVARERLLPALLRRVLGRLGGLLGADLRVIEDGVTVATLKSRGFFGRRIELEFMPIARSRTLFSTDPRVLMALSVLLALADSDSELPSLLA